MGSDKFSRRKIVAQRQRHVSFAINTLLNKPSKNTTSDCAASLRCSIFFASLHEKADIVSPSQKEVIGSEKMTLARNLNMIAFLAAFAFLAAIVVGVI
jgi:hypothetical protein